MNEILALVVTDIVDSTRLCYEAGHEQAAKWWTAHDSLARDLLAKWSGWEVQISDGIVAVFSDVTDALGYAEGYHRGLTQESLPFVARAGVHVGPVLLRESSETHRARGARRADVGGLTLAVANRLASIAQGGQTLLSREAVDALKSPCQLRSHGFWLLKGLPAPIEVFGADRVERLAEPPIESEKAVVVVPIGDHWVPQREVRHSLPAERDSFVGRLKLLRECSDAFDDSRVVTMAGAGGVGKTRAALHFAWSTLAKFPGGAWFCELAPLQNLEDLLKVTAHSLGLLASQTDLAAQIGGALAGRGRCLVVLDNFEHLTEFAEETIGGWLEQAPHAQFLVTSRQALEIVGERVLWVEPMELHEGVELFQRRARASWSGFALRESERVELLKLVDALDRLPLALELAAARVRTMTLSEMLGRITSRFEWLSGRPTRHGRQRTLKETIAWSWDLLNDDEQRTLAKLTVFQGGSTLEAAVCVAEHPYGRKHINSLITKSLVRLGASNRLSLFESVQQYAAERLAQWPRSQGEAMLAHVRFFSALGERRAIAEKCADSHNIILACKRAASANLADEAVGAMVASWYVLRLTGPLRSAIELATEVLALSGLSGDARATVHWVAGSDYSMIAETEQVLRHFQLGMECAASALSKARLLAMLGAHYTVIGEMDKSHEKLKEAELLVAQMEEPSIRLYILSSLGRCMDFQGELSKAMEYYESALKLAVAVNDRRYEGGMLGNLGGILLDAGDLEGARHKFTQALSFAQELGDRRWEGNARCNLGLVLHGLGRLPEAEEQLKHAIKLADEVGAVSLHYSAECNLGIVFESRGDTAAAAMLFRNASEAAETAGDLRASGQFLGFLANVLARRGQLADARKSGERAEYLLRKVNDDLSRALVLCQRASVELWGGSCQSADDLLQAAETIRLRLGASEESELAGKIKSIRATLRERGAQASVRFLRS